MFSLTFKELQILILSGVPFTELRLTIPLAVALGIKPLKAFLLACTGNFIPIAPFLLLLGPFSKLISKIPYFNKAFFTILEKTRAKGEKVEKYGALGLLLFVAVPFPGTGIYSGAILAFLFGIRFWYAFWALTVGMLIAAVAVTVASTGALEIARYIYELEYFFLIFLLLGLVFFFFKKIRKVN